MLACATQGCSYLNANFHAVDDGRLYGSGQMHADALERGLQEHDVQSVISLRSARPEETWYHDELAVCDALGVAYYSLGWSKNRLPTPESLKEFIHLLEESDGPLLATLPGRRASDQRRSSRICSSARRRKRGRNWRGALTMHPLAGSSNCTRGAKSPLLFGRPTPIPSSIPKHGRATDRLSCARGPTPSLLPVGVCYHTRTWGV